MTHYFPTRRSSDLVYGPDTNSEARIQFSFKYQLFASRRAEGLPRSWRDGLHFGYTQRMFWDLGAYSSPFRNIDFQPELFYLTPRSEEHTSELQSLMRISYAVFCLKKKKKQTYIHKKNNNTTQLQQP